MKGAIALSLAIYLLLQSPALVYLYILAVTGLIIDAIAVIKGKHKSILNEIVGMAALCLLHLSPMGQLREILISKRWQCGS